MFRKEISMELVCAENIDKIYRQGNENIEAIKDVSCTIMPGDRIAVMGPSGSGKSTLLQLLGGLDSPTSGSICWPLLGKRETLRPQKIGYVFQTKSLLPSLNVMENMKLPLVLADTDAETANTAAMEALELIGLSDLKDKLPEELSGGQLQRIAVARVLTVKPRLILADEPTGQLDRATAQYLIDVLLSYSRGTGTAIMIATHDMSVANRMDALWNMQHGTLEVNK